MYPSHTAVVYTTLAIVIYLEIIAVANLYTGYIAEAVMCVVLAALNLAIFPAWLAELLVPAIAILNNRRPWYLALVMPLAGLCTMRSFYHSRKASSMPTEETV
jgi:hypothetical protein